MSYNVLIIQAHGALVDEQSCVHLMRRFEQAMKDKIKNVVLIMEKVTSVEEFGLAALIACQQTVRSFGGDIKLVNPPPEIADYLSRKEQWPEQLKGAPGFEIFDTLKKAKAGFGTHAVG